MNIPLRSGNADVRLLLAGCGNRLFSLWLTHLIIYVRWQRHILHGEGIKYLIASALLHINTTGVGPRQAARSAPFGYSLKSPTPHVLLRLAFSLFKLCTPQLVIAAFYVHYMYIDETRCRIIHRRDKLSCEYFTLHGWG